MTHPPELMPIEKCPNHECRHECKLTNSVTARLYPPGTVTMYFVVCDLECGYRGAFADTEAEAIRLHNALCRPTIPWLDAASTKTLARELADSIDFTGERWQAKEAFEVIISRHAGGGEHDDADRRQNIQTRSLLVRDTAKKARERGHHETAACFEYAATILETIMTGTDKELVDTLAGGINAYREISPAPTSAPEGLHKLVKKWRKGNAAVKPKGGYTDTDAAYAQCADELEAALSAAEKGK